MRQLPHGFQLHEINNMLDKTKPVVSSIGSEVTVALQITYLVQVTRFMASVHPKKAFEMPIQSHLELFLVGACHISLVRKVCC